MWPAPLKHGSNPPVSPCPRVPVSQTEGSRLREHLSEQEDRLKTVEEDSERKDQRIQELQRLLGGMEQESAALRETIRSREEELGNLRRMREEGREGEDRSVNSRLCTEQEKKDLCSETNCVDFQSQAAGEGGVRSEREDPPSGRHAEEPAKESQTHDRTGEGHMAPLKGRHLDSGCGFKRDSLGV